MIEEAQVRIITKKVLDEEHLLGHIKIFEKEHNLFRGSHDKIQLPAALNVPQQIVNTISKKIKLEELEDVSIPTKAVGDFIQYNEATEKWTRQAALAEGSIVIAIADGYFSEDNTNLTWDNTSKTFKVIGNTFLDGAVVINDSNADKDFRVEGSGATYTHLLFTDASANMVGINEDAPKALLHIRLSTCADYAGVHPNSALILEGSGNISLQLQGATTGTAYIAFTDDNYNPPPGRIAYSFADDEMNFAIGGNVLVFFRTTGARFVQHEMEVDSATGYSAFIANAHNADAYFALEEDEAIKWSMGFDYTDSLKFQISEGIPGTNVRFEIEPGAAGLINCYQDLALRSSQEIRFYHNGNYVGFKAVGLSADQIWILPAADGPANEVLGTDGAGNLIWRTHDELAGFVANEHIDHSAVSISAGGILSGGGDITASRTISLAHGDVDHDQTANFAAGEHLAALDEDNMVSNSDTNVATQQSIKAYVDALVGTHALLDGSIHSDTVADAVTRGSIIYGNATPKWDELVIGAADTFLGSDGTDLSYRTAAQVLASLSGEAGAAFAWNSQDLTGIGTIAATTAKLSDLTDGYLPYHVADATGLANSPIFTDGTNVIIGSASITHDFEIVRAGATTWLQTDFTLYCDSVSHYPRIHLRKSHSNVSGTLTTTVDTEYLGEITFYGVDSGSNLDKGVRIYAIQNGVAGVRVPTDLFINTFSSTAANTNQLVLHHDGNTGFGINTPSGHVHIYGTGVQRLKVESPTNSGYVNAILELKSYAAARGGGVLLSNSNETNKWFFGSPYNSADFVINWASTATETDVFQAGTTTKLLVSYAGIVLINDTTNTKMARGLTINQLDADNEILALKSSDIAHAMTGQVEADTYGRFLKTFSATGGLMIDGYGESAYGIYMRGCATVDNTSKDTTALAPFMIASCKDNGSNNVRAVGADANLFVILDYSVARFIVDKDGDIFYDGGASSYQNYDDIALIAELEDVLSDKISRQEMKRKDIYKKHKVVHVSEGITEEEGPFFSRFVSTKRKNMLIYGAIRQLNEKIEALEAQLNN